MKIDGVWNSEFFKYVLTDPVMIELKEKLLSRPAWEMEVPVLQMRAKLLQEAHAAKESLIQLFSVHMHLRAVGLILSCVHNEILAGVVRILQKK